MIPLTRFVQDSRALFKQYNKAKTAAHVLREQIQRGQVELDYLDSILDELSRAELEQDFNDVRAELQAGGYLKNLGGSRREPKRGLSKPRQFRSSSGLKILVGRSNTQNDRLTRDAFKWDIWFHTQKIHGSHVILCTEGEEPDQSPPGKTAGNASDARLSAPSPARIREAATLRPRSGSRSAQSGSNWATAGKLPIDTP